MKKVLSALVLGMALSTGFMAEAGSIPSNMVPLQTYAIKRVNCYLSPNGQQKGWIDPGDYVIVQKIQNGWAYGSYPVGNKRIARWFRADDLVYNVGFANQQRYSPKQNTYTYKDPNRKGIFGSFNDNEPLTVVSDYGEQRQFIYKVSGGGYKMAWVPYWDCWKGKSGYNPTPTPAPTPKPNPDNNIGNKLNNLAQKWNGRSWEPYGKGNGSNSRWPNGEKAFGGQCLGFANYIFQEIHGSKCGDGYGTIKYKLSRLQSNVYQVNSSSWLDANKAKEMLLNAPVGSFLQLKRRSSGSQHSAILLARNQNQVTILDANGDYPSNNIIRIRYFSYADFAKKNTAMSIYNKR